MPSQSTVPVKMGIMEPFSLIRRQPPDKSTSTKRKMYESVTDCLDCSEQSGWKITILQESIGNQKRLKNDHFLVCQLEQKNSAITATNSFTSPEVTTMQEIKDEHLLTCIVNFCSISIPNICMDEPFIARPVCAHLLAMACARASLSTFFPCLLNFINSNLGFNMLHQRYVYQLIVLNTLS